MFLAGCPVNERSWVIKQWVKHLKRAADFAEIDLILACVIPSHDSETQNALQEACLANSVEVFLDLVDEEKHDDKRVWNANRYEHMAMLRNRLLDMVRLLDPQYFLSIDSDILIGREVIPPLIKDLDRFDAVAGKIWLHPQHIDIVNWANLRQSGGGIRRKNVEGSFEVDVIMALKLMSRDAFWIDYSSHSQGEDFGWSKNARENGLKLGWNGFLPSKHIMNEDALHMLDKRVGW